MALQVLRQDPSRFSYTVQLGGFVVSGDLPGDGLLTLSRPPVFWGRGALDRVIPDDAIARTETWIRDHADGQVRVYAGLGHDVAGREIDDLMGFVRRHTPRRTS
jgi:phospholipase/carboxylesterase